MKKLPIGISTLEKIRNEDYIYIDKSHHVANLFNSGGRYYFLSRPRRFGKSLFIDTLKQAFLGRKDLFTGLYLEHNWDWDTKYPVLHFTFAEGDLASAQELDNKINRFLDNYYQEYQISNVYTEVSSRFSYLVETISAQHNKVVILIDEYDKPILDNITDLSLAAEMRRKLRNFYSVIKALDAHIQFAMLTGVSKFSKVSLFSGLNILDDLTLKSSVADICGYTQSELEREFAEYLVNVDKITLKQWYNGYNFAGKEEQKVYNPFDILLFFSNNNEYRAYWFETATPTFLIQLIQKNRYYFPELEGVVVNPEELSSFDIENIPITTLLFQTGYLTIKTVLNEADGLNYELSYPNFEVKTSLNRHLAGLGDSFGFNRSRRQLLVALQTSDFSTVQTIFSAHFAAIPNDWYRNNYIASYEGFYASVVYSYFAALGYELIAEDVTNHGKIDLTIKMPDKILIIEFKLNKYGNASEAIAQIRSKGYASKYLAENKEIYLLGMSFDCEQKNVVDFICELN